MAGRSSSNCCVEAAHVNLLLMKSVVGQFTPPNCVSILFSVRHVPGLWIVTALAYSSFTVRRYFRQIFLIPGHSSQCGPLLACRAARIAWPAGSVRIGLLIRFNSGSSCR